MFPRGRDLANVLRYEWEARLPPTPSSQRITVGDVNDALNRIDRAHAHRGHGKAEILRGLITGRCNGLEIKWLVRVLLRDLTIGLRASMPVAHKGEWPKLVMDGFCRAQGRLGKPSTGNPPLLYSLFRHQHSLEHVARKAETGSLPTTYPPPCCLGTHVRVQGSVPCTDTSAEAVLARFVFRRDELDRRIYIETKYDGFRLQIHYERQKDSLRLFYRRQQRVSEESARVGQ